MKEVILNGYLKIKPLEYNSFVAAKDTYEQVGILLAKADDVDIPIGARCWFDSFMCRKYPVPGKENEYEWFVPKGEIIKYEIDAS